MTNKIGVAADEIIRLPTSIHFNHFKFIYEYEQIRFRLSRARNNG